MAATSAQSGTHPIEKIAFVSLGCPKNLIDSETMLAALAEAGLALVSGHDEADCIIINTCGFLEAAKEESLAAIHEAIGRKETGRAKRIVVAGCLPQRHRAKLLDWAPGIDAMIGVFDRDHIVDAVRGETVRDAPPYWIAANALQAARARGLPTASLTVRGADGRGIGYYEDESHRFRLTPRHWAYLRISEGCNQNCAFCTIPSIRGKMRSKPPEVIVREARQLMSEGVFELNLIGEDTTSYGRDIGGSDGVTKRRSDEGAEGRERVARGDLVGLLEALNDVAGEVAPTSGGGLGPTSGGGAYSGGWVRVMYAYPTNFTDEMIEAIASLPNIVKYIDMPLQHITDRMLSAMRRHTTRAAQETLLNRLRERIPGLAIRTTFITGFPGETEDDHRRLVDFIEEFQFDMLGVFRYSREDGTPAGTMDGDAALHVPDEVKDRREEELMLTQQSIAFENARYVAEQRCQFDVLIDGPAVPLTLEEHGGHRETGEAASGAAQVWRGGQDERPSPPTPLPEGEGSMHLSVGRCYHQAPQVDSVTYVRSIEPLAPGELVRCTIVEADGYDLIARPTAELERKASLPIV